MLTWKRTFITAAVLANVLVFIVPGAAFIIMSMGELKPPGATYATPNRDVAFVTGAGLLAIGVFGLLCMRFSSVTRGRKQGSWIGMGSSWCIVLAIFGLVFATGAGHPLPIFVLGGVAFVTGLALMHLRPKRSGTPSCPKCDYDLTGLSGGVCPECGLNKTERDAFAAE